MSEFVVYSGTGPSSVDGKGRLTIPADLRHAVQASSGANEVHLQRHPSLRCLVGFGKVERDNLRLDIEQRSDAAASQLLDFDRQKAALAIPSVYPMPFEPSGRFVLHPLLADYAHLTKEKRVFFMGMITHFLIWNADIFDAEAPAEFDGFRFEYDYWFKKDGKGSK